MGAVVLDASIVIALLDLGDELARRAGTAVERLRPDSEFYLPASAYAEALVAAFRRDEVALRRGQLDAVATVIPLGPDIAVEAARLRARPRPLRLPDALVVATGEVLGATVLTGDRTWKRHSRLVEVV